MNGCCRNSVYRLVRFLDAGQGMVQTLRNPALLLEEALRFAVVIGCAVALIGAGRFVPF
jgi:hypothetical protein